MDSASGAKLGGFILSLKQVSRLTQLLGGRQLLHWDYFRLARHSGTISELRVAGHIALTPTRDERPSAANAKEGGAKEWTKE